MSIEEGTTVMEDNELPYWTLDEIFELFGYKNKQSAYVAISRGCFPVHTYRLAGRRVADCAVVREFFRARRREGVEALAKRLGPV